SHMPRAWSSLSEMSSRTVMPSSWMEGKDRMGRARRLSAVSCSCSHAFISIAATPRLFAELYGGVGGAGRVGGVAVGADLLAEGLGDGGAAHHDLHMIPDVGGLRGLDHLTHDA